MGRLRFFFLAVDVGFIVYWLVALTHALPASWLYADADDPRIVAWNVSFLPLDLMVSASGITSIVLARRKSPAWRPVALLSLAFTMASGLNAVAFWAARRDFDWAWWAPNLFLLLYPIPFVIRLTKELQGSRAKSTFR